MMRRIAVGRALVLTVVLSLAGSATGVIAQVVTAPVAKSKAHAKELVTALTSKKLEAFAMRDPADPNRFLAVLHIPNVQFLVVSANYERPADLDYGFYNKDFTSIYADLNNSAMSKAKVFVEDAVCDGLVALPGKNDPRDSVTIGTERRTFDGEFVDNKKKDAKKPTQDDYLKSFVDADDKYDHMLTLLLDELKKPGL